MVYDAAMDEGRKRVIGLMAAILASLHMQTADDLFGGPQGSPTDGQDDRRKYSVGREDNGENRHEVAFFAMRDLSKPVDFQISDEELRRVLREIDDELRAKGTKLYGRAIQGWLLFSRRFRLGLTMSDPLAVRIFDWFTEQYGERLTGNLDFGNTVVEIGHDFYSLNLCRIFGTVIVHCDPLLVDKNFGPRATMTGSNVKTNLFEALQGVTTAFIKSLTLEECNNLLEAYSRGFL